MNKENICENAYRIFMDRAKLKRLLFSDAFIPDE